MSFDLNQYSNEFDIFSIIQLIGKNPQTCHILLPNQHQIVYVPPVTDQLRWVILENDLFPPVGHKKIGQTGSEASSHHHTPGLKEVPAIKPEIIVHQTKS